MHPLKGLSVPGDGQLNSSSSIAVPEQSSLPILVIGAGMAGSAAANALNANGYRVQLLDKARGAGGRLSRRRVNVNGLPLSFEHGAPFFRGTNSDFLAKMNSWSDEGLIAPWTGRFIHLTDLDDVVEDEDSRWCGVPTMNALCKALISPLKLAPRWGIRVVKLVTEGQSWLALDDQGASHGPYQGIVLSAPAPQCVPLLADHAPAIAQACARVTFDPCMAAMVAFRQRPPFDWHGATLKDGPLSWVAEECSKPGRIKHDGLSAWTLHASAQWSRHVLEDPPDQTAKAMLSHLAELVRFDLPDPLYLKGHRWRFARPTQMTCSVKEIPDDIPPLVTAGDWCGETKLEAAWISGTSAAARLSVTLTER